MDYHRRSIRLNGFDYSSDGWYFVTICVQNRECLFGDVVDGEMKLNDVGNMVNSIWNEIPDNYPGIYIGKHQIMPNHFHGIIRIVGAGPRACPGLFIGGQQQNTEEGQPRGMGKGQPRGVAPTMSLSNIVHRFKSLTTRKYFDGVKNLQWPMVDHRFWQRNYYEHIIRDESDHIRIKEYIENNPENWEKDTLFIGS